MSVEAGEIVIGLKRKKVATVTVAIKRIAAATPVVES